MSLKWTNSLDIQTEATCVKLVSSTRDKKPQKVPYVKYSSFLCHVKLEYVIQGCYGCLCSTDTESFHLFALPCKTSISKIAS